MVTIVAVLGGAFQLRELAQLPRERTVAPRLLVTFKRLGERPLGTPRPPGHVSDTAGLGWWVGSMVASIIACVVFLVLWKEHPARLLTPVSAAVAFGLLPNVLAELASSDKTPGDLQVDAERELADSVGELRLDRYIHDHDWATYVDKIIEMKLKSQTTPADGHEPEPRCC